MSRRRNRVFIGHKLVLGFLFVELGSGSAISLCWNLGLPESVDWIVFSFPVTTQKRLRSKV